MRSGVPIYAAAAAAAADESSTRLNSS